MSHAQLEIWPDQQRDEFDVVTLTAQGNVIWRRYRDGRIAIVPPGAVPTSRDFEERSWAGVGHRPKAG